MRGGNDYMADLALKLAEEAREVVKALGEVEWPSEPFVPEGAAAEVLWIMSGRSRSLFRLLDEKPGNSIWNGYKGLAGEWHWKLRRVRNHRGSELLGVLEAS